MDCAFDLDGTIIGHWANQDGSMAVALRPEAERWISEARRSCRRVVLWTFGNRQWYEELAELFPILRTFDEVHTRDELPGRETVHGGFRERVKDVRMLGVDLLVDNDPSHGRWAERHGLARHYLLVPRKSVV